MQVLVWGCGLQELSTVPAALHSQSARTKQLVHYWLYIKIFKQKQLEKKQLHSLMISPAGLASPLLLLVGYVGMAEQKKNGNFF